MLICRFFDARYTFSGIFRKVQMKYQPRGFRHSGISLLCLFFVQNVESHPFHLLVCWFSSSCVMFSWISLTPLVKCVVSCSFCISYVSFKCNSEEGCRLLNQFGFMDVKLKVNL